MTSTNNGVAGAQLMRVDRRGRVHAGRERREALLDEFERSGVSAAQFARVAGIKYTTFSNWRQARARARRAAGRVEVAGLGLMEAVIDAEGANVAGMGAGLVIELPGGGRMRIETPLQLRLAAELLAMMAPASRC
jgi:hypothetical protein